MASAEEQAPAEESSDFSYPDEVDLKDKARLLKWKYQEGGHRIPLFIPTVPHVDDTEVYRSVDVDETAVLELGARLVADAKQIHREYIYAQQRCDLLRQERDLLKWHLASNSRVLKLKEGELEGAEIRTANAERQLKSILLDADRFEREKRALATDVSKREKLLDEAGKEFEKVSEEMKEWLSHRGNYIADTTLERKRAEKERSLRYRQWKKLQRACNADKKWHSRINAVMDADTMVFEEYENIHRLLAVEFEKAGDVTGPIRRLLVEPKEESPFEGFVRPKLRLSESGRLDEDGMDM